jgi:protein KRI1
MLCVVEDKLARKSLKRKRPSENMEPSGLTGDSTSDSDSEDEDDAGELATEALDSEIFATLNAIRTKDPRVYDKNTTFYTQEAGSQSDEVDQKAGKKEKPMFLRDYHRETLLNGVNDELNHTSETPLTYNQEQEALKQSIVAEINAARPENSITSASDDDMESSQSDDGFLVAKPRKAKTSEQPLLDVENADKDPETFLSNFMAARAWVPSERAQFQPLESDDDEEDRKAEEFEEAYNFRFEDPAKSNEKLISHARDIAAKYSVRREEKNPRKKQREAEGEKKEAAKRERAQEKARLRKLKIEEAEEKLQKIKKAAGLKGSGGLTPEDLARILDDDWNDAEWEEEMQRRFGESYYAQEDGSSDGDAPGVANKRRKPKKPKWDDDIEINDLVPDFDAAGPAVELSDEPLEEEAEEVSRKDRPRKTGKEHAKERQDEKKERRKERLILEQLVDDRLELNTALAGSQRNASGFRYRETSPLSFGLSARDILMAEDSQLNEYVGLKKLAAFRDPGKKRKDQKQVGKKARLRQWRRETFGIEEGPILPASTDPMIGVDAEAAKRDEDGGVDLVVRSDATRKKRRRSKRNKIESVAQD